MLEQNVSLEAFTSLQNWNSRKCLCFSVMSVFSWASSLCFTFCSFVSLPHFLQRSLRCQTISSHHRSTVHHLSVFGRPAVPPSLISLFLSSSFFTFYFTSSQTSLNQSNLTSSMNNYQTDIAKSLKYSAVLIISMNGCYSFLLLLLCLYLVSVPSLIGLFPLCCAV